MMKGSTAALNIWESIPNHVRVKLLNNAYCSHCRGVCSIADAYVVLEGECFLIKGDCVDCHGPVARYVEGIGETK